MNEYPRAESYGRTAAVTRRRLLTGAGAVLVAGGLAACGADDGAKAKRTGGARTSPAAAPVRKPPPVAIPEHPKLRRLGAAEGGHTDEVAAFRFSPDGRTLAGVSQTGDLRLWDAATGKERATAHGGKGVHFRDLAFSPDGRTVVTSSDGRLQFWDATTLRSLGKDVVRPVKEYAQNFSAIAYSPDGRALVTSGSMAWSTRLRDPATGAPIGAPLSPRMDDVLVFSADGRTLAGLNASDGVRIWDVATRKQRATSSIDGLGQTTSGPGRLAMSPDGTTIGTVADEPDEVAQAKVYLLSATTGKQRGEPLGGHFGGVSGLAYATDGRTIVTSDFWGLHFWDATTHEKRASASVPGSPPIKRELGPGATLTKPGSRSIYDFALSPDGRTVAISSGPMPIKTKLTLWRLE